MKKVSTDNDRSIGVFDSGVGGLSVLLELKKELPNENFVFLADQLYVPYGEKSIEELVTLTSKITDYFVREYNIKMMVVACNTATCGAIGELRKKYSFPIVGTVPAIKPAAEGTKTGTIGVISTPFTSRSKALQDLIKDNCKGVKVINIGCKDLEDTVEQGDLESPAVYDLLAKYLKPIKESKADALILGCTHYPFLKEPIRKILGSKVRLVDGNKGIARHTKSLLFNHMLENNSKKTGKTEYLTTGDSAEFTRVASTLIENRIKSRKVAI